MSINDDGPLSGSTANGISAGILAGYDDLVELYLEGYGASGYIPFTKPLTPYGQYQYLQALRGAGDPTFWADPTAQAALAKLETRYGPSAALAGPGVMPAGIPARTGAVLGTTMTSDRLGQPALPASLATGAPNFLAA